MPNSKIRYKELSDTYNNECTEFLIEILKGGKLIRTKTSGGSMYPFICKNDYIVIRPADFKEIHVGDIIAYRKKGGDGLLTGHRVVRKNHRYFVTKGDANKYSDNLPVFPGDIYGKVIKIEKRDRIVELESISKRITSYIYARLSLIIRYIAEHTLRSNV